MNPTQHYWMTDQRRTKRVNNRHNLDPYYLRHYSADFPKLMSTFAAFFVMLIIMMLVAWAATYDVEPVPYTQEAFRDNLKRQVEGMK